MDERAETTQALRQAMVEDLRVTLASAKSTAHDVACNTAAAGLSVAALGWAQLCDDIEALLERARRLPK